MMMDPAGSGNNITVVSEPKSDVYEKMTVESFNSTLKPILEAAGMTVSNVSIAKKTSNGLNVVEISYKAEMLGVKVNQTVYVVAAGQKNWAITITEVKPDANLITTVFETLQTAK